MRVPTMHAGGDKVVHLHSSLASETCRITLEGVIPRRRPLQVFRWFCAGLLFLILRAPAHSEDVLQIGGFGRDAVGMLSEGKGFLKAEGIRTEYHSVRASVELMENFVSGKYDLIHTTADNVIAWAEGQGADRKPHDFILFIGGRKGLTNELVVAPDIKSFADLKGSKKLFAVDAYNTGYAPVLVAILSKHGIFLKKDYEMKPLGGGRDRLESVKKGETIGGMLSLDEDLKKRGFYVLARSQDYFPVYAVAIGAARRDWAQQHEDLLVRYTRALIRTTDWILNPENKPEALQILRAALQGSAEQAQEQYDAAADSKFGLIPRAKINTEGVKVILEIRKVMGEMKDPLPSPNKYIEERYYQKAIASLAAGR